MIPTSSDAVAGIGALIYAYRDLLPLLDEHSTDNFGEVLPHLPVTDVVDWMVDNLSLKPDVCRSILEWMEQEIVAGPPYTRNMIDVSAVEAMPGPAARGNELRAMFGQICRKRTLGNLGLAERG